MKAVSLMILKPGSTALLAVLLSGTALADDQSGLYGQATLNGVSAMSDGALKTTTDLTTRLAAEKAGLEVADASAQRFASRAIDTGPRTASPKPVWTSSDFSWIPKPGPWMTLLAVIGFTGMMIGRTKRRYF